MPVPLPVSFAAGPVRPDFPAQWRINRIINVAGDGLADASTLAVTEGAFETTTGAVWTLRGFTSNVRYARRIEADRLVATQADLGRTTASEAVLIPIRKTEDWWALAQDERRAIMEEQSHHIEIGLDYLPAVARRLHHCRDLGEPFDFLTWFEFAPEHEPAFDHMLIRLRATEEWRYVDREVEVRLTRA